MSFFQKYAQERNAPVNDYKYIVGPESVDVENNAGYLSLGSVQADASTSSQFAETKGPFRNEGVCSWVEQMRTKRPSCCHLGLLKQMQNNTMEAEGNIIEDGIWFI